MEKLGVITFLLTSSATNIILMITHLLNIGIYGGSQPKTTLTNAKT